MANHKRGTLPQEICEKYTSGCTIAELAKENGMAISTMRLWLISSGVKMRTMKEAIANSDFDFGIRTRGKERPRFSDEHRRKLSESRKGKGRGYSLKACGYIQITIGPNKHRGQHAVIMEGIIGRKLENGECVHHRDRDKSNNKPENLQLMTRASHTALHRKEDHYGKSK